MKITSHSHIPDNISKDVLNLLCNSFPGDREYLESNFLKKFNSQEKQIWYIASEDNGIQGVLNICYRVMNFKGNDLSVCGLSYMAIDKKKQNTSLSNIFQNIVLKESYSKDISLGFARKKMDGYWVPKGFVGITDFAEFNIRNNGLSFESSPNREIPRIPSLILDKKRADSISL